MAYYRRSGVSPKMLAAGATVVVVAAAGAAHHHTHHTPARHVAAATPAAASVTGNVALGRRMAARYGWTGHQWTCLDWLWTRESGWREVWNYQGSGAYGIPQALPASKMASAGADYMTNPRTEIRWGLGYIRLRYVTPCGAWAHEESDSWY